MAEKTFDRETLLDLTVNAIPLGMILFFVVLFLVISPYESAPVVTVIQFSILGSMLVALFLLTYYAGKAISTAESELEGEAHETTVDPHAEDGH